MASQLPSGSGYMLPGVQVTITRPITSGDRIRAYWTHTQTKKIEWVKGNEEDGCVWDFILSEEVSLEKETSLTYKQPDPIADTASACRNRGASVWCRWQRFQPDVRGAGTAGEH